MLDDLNFGSGGGAYIATPSGEILTVSTSLSSYNKSSEIFSLHTDAAGSSGSFERLILNEKMIVCYTVSSLMGFHFVSATPSRVVMAKVTSVGRICWIITVAVLSLGLLLAYVLSYLHSNL